MAVEGVDLRDEEDGELAVCGARTGVGLFVV